MLAADFLRHLNAGVPYKVHAVLTANGFHFTDPKYPGTAVGEVKLALAVGEIFRCHVLRARLRAERHRSEAHQPRHPWTNGQLNE
jgi:hypothetical protein